MKSMKWEGGKQAGEASEYQFKDLNNSSLPLGMSWRNAV